MSTKWASICSSSSYILARDRSLVGGVGDKEDGVVGRLEDEGGGVVGRLEDEGDN
jgi:hypothetical protein